ncbi:MAG: SMP-30/gluconolactonase/LRE family protein [Parasporobacterium sp.]|nr:SMP-30/gluconolactonase/LRE family protein [Parasporobacterium sp.]
MRKCKWISVIGMLLACMLVFGSVFTVYAAPEEGQSAEGEAASDGEQSPESEDSEGESAEEAGGIPAALLAAPEPLLLPPEVAGLETIEAEPWLQISAVNPGLEGPAFDDEGYLYICDTSPISPENHILKIGEDQQIEAIYAGTEDPVGLAFDADGRLYAACMSGDIMAMDKDGGNLEIITPLYEGEPFSPNDIVFTAEGNMYVTDWRGTIVDPIGGIYMLTKESGFKDAVKLVGNLASPNGISLSPDGTVLWIGVSLANTVLKITLDGEGKVSDMLGILPVYQNTGSDVPDSNKTDSAGNLYQVFMQGGRVLIFNSNGVPIKNVIIPERSQGMLSMTSNMIIKPGTTEAYILAADFVNGAWLYRFDALAEGK